MPRDAIYLGVAIVAGLLLAMSRPRVETVVIPPGEPLRHPSGIAFFS